MIRLFAQLLLIPIAACLCSVEIVRAEDQLQTPPPTVDSPNEWIQIKNSCFAFKIKDVPDCFENLFLGNPYHIPVGSIAPQDGFAAGAAYSDFKNTNDWRIKWNADAVASINASWRAGLYFNFVHSGQSLIGFHKGTTDADRNVRRPPEHLVLSIYGQPISLNNLTYFGLGPTSTESGRSFYGMREINFGGTVVKPIYDPLKISLFGEVNGRFVSLRPSTGQPCPSIGQLYDESTAPGLTTQPGFIQLGEGLRMTSVSSNSILRWTNLITYQQYLAPTDSTYSFQRLTVDLGLELALYGKTMRFVEPRVGNGPDGCSSDPGEKYSPCPKPFARNREGSINLRFLTDLSITPGGHFVPFYFQPTLGGSDINGNNSLSSYQDYRFRAPNVMLLREGFEHSIFRWPVGFVISADEGKVGLERGDLGSN